jgi:hypothetical protein
MKQWISSYRLTPVGGLLIVVGIAGLIAAAAGPRSAQLPGLLTAIIVGVFLVAGSGVGLRGRPRDLAERRADFRPSSREEPDARADSSAEAEAWRAERERYGRRG